MRDPAQRAPQFGAATSRSLHEAALEVLPGGTSRSIHQTQPHPLYARDGRGCIVTDVDGNQYLDFYNNASALIHGHAHADVVAAIEGQARRGTAFSLPVEQQIELARLICARIPSADQVRFVNSGSEAVMLAIRAARALTDRPKVVKFEGLYHGSADAVEVSLEPDPDAWGSDAAPSSVAYTRGTPRGVLESVVVAPFNDIPAAERILRAHAHELAAVIVDCMPMRLGAIAARPAWVAALRRLTRELGILLISDEVVSFRVEYGGPQALYGFEADVTVLGKIVGGGLPIGVVAGPRDVMRVFDGSSGRAMVPNAGTFNANPLTLAAGIAALNALPASEVQRIGELGDALRTRARSVFRSLGVAGQATGIGSLFGIHLTDRSFENYREYWRACVADPEARQRQRALYDGLLARGILFSTGGVGTVSTAMTDAEIDAFIAALADCCREMQVDAASMPRGPRPVGESSRSLA
jgi:glutamate-1-semialdehyde 2,1-aminomutase